MKKKKILFVMNSLTIGGAEKSLLTILSLLDYRKYDVDLFLFGIEGAFLKDLPSKVRLLSEDKEFKLFEKNKLISPILFLLKGDLKKSFYCVKYILGYLKNKLFLKREIYLGWESVKHIMNNINKSYDTSIGFMERYAIYFNVDKVNAKNKIGFIHNDYSIYPYDDKLDRYYFKNYNKIATVSEHCKDVLIELFPEYKDKFIVIKNMVSKELIKKLSREKITNNKLDKNSINLVSVGRLVKQKGFDQAVLICKKLIGTNPNIHWYIIGEGKERTNLEALIKENKLENNFFLIGADTNPYKWINIADIYVQPSRFEGYGITVAEAKSLNKPIVASDIPEFRELLNDDKGLLSKNMDDFVINIEKLIKDKKLKTKLIANLKQEKNTLEELDKLEKIM